MATSREIGAIKRANGMTVYQAKHWLAAIANRLQQAEALGLDADFTKDLFEKIHAESIRVQLDN